MLEKLRWLIKKLMFFSYVYNIKSIEALAGVKPPTTHMTHHKKNFSTI
ncbi:MAG: hypothetical protein SCABRO_02604 [Candidatus Scalindua brodae]|uniref:Uncharacterized protein n=1 Tax=Candidatus Scalindua brodae TaxID=237368 RepID=A0A0B0EHZ9_9BACT|nr:MAG: hypothetical protein SCABRO_02604 [Candidatus Scalindua brodae]